MTKKIRKSTSIAKCEVWGQMTLQYVYFTLSQVSHSIEVKPAIWDTCVPLFGLVLPIDLNCSHLIAEVDLWCRETVKRFITPESVRCVILLNSFLSSKMRGINPITHPTAEKETPAGSLAGSCVATKRSPQTFVRGRWRLGVRGLGETVERGALRAGMWLLLRESYVRTKNEKQARQQRMHLQGASHTCKVRQTTLFSHKLKTKMNRNFSRKMI